MAKKRRGRDISGIIVLDKPKGESSNASLQKVKRLLSAVKAGHTGSLDPLATGVLPLCFGEATKVSQFLLDSDKRYRVKIKFGIKTNSGDSEGDVIREGNAESITEEKIKQSLGAFLGEIEQLPPMFSALKHNGVPLYKLARQGKVVERKTRKITVYDILFFNYEKCELELEIFSSKGTYIRAIADDLGDLLGCGGHVIELRRLQAGPFNLDHSVTAETLAALIDAEGVEACDKYLMPTDEAVRDLPEVILPEMTANYLKQGQPVQVKHVPTEGLVRLYEADSFIGIGEILDDGRVAPRRLFKNL